MFFKFYYQLIKLRAKSVVNEIRNSMQNCKKNIYPKSNYVLSKLFLADIDFN